MATQCYEVRNWSTPDGGVVRPNWVQTKGYFEKEDGHFLCFIKDSEERNYYVPDGLVSKTKEEFVQEALTFMDGHTQYESEEDMENGVEPTPMSADSIRAWAEAEYDQRIAE